MKKRVGIYARYSSDLQSDASIEDQIRNCTEKAKAEKWKIVNCYTDAGISGASLLRPGIQSLISASMNVEFDILLAEAIDRLSRDQEDIAGIYKRMEFAGIEIITLSEGKISPLHIGLKGTMNAMFLKDLADKTRRGLKGRIAKGKSAGGLPYGYKVRKDFTLNGELIRGKRDINEAQAKIVRRIFYEYAYQNKSPKIIASDLNKDGIPCPSGKEWGQSTINGNRRRGTGILNNHLYIGELIWNRQRFIKDPSTGKRVGRYNPEDEWVRIDVPDLRIVPPRLWNAAKAKQKELDKRAGSLSAKKRPRHLLSGLLKCGECKGGFSKVNTERYGCSTARNKGESVCKNKKTIKASILEDAVLNALETHLMRDELVQVFCDEYKKHTNHLRSLQQSTLKKHETKLSKLEKERANIIQAIKDGVPADLIKDELEKISERQSELKTLIKKESGETRPELHPSMGDRYRKAIKGLRKALKDGKYPESKEHVRALIEKIVLTPKDDHKEFSIDLHGDLAGILNIASKGDAMKKLDQKSKRPYKKTVNDNFLIGPSITVVAGKGFEPMTFGL